MKNSILIFTLTLIMLSCGEILEMHEASNFEELYRAPGNSFFIEGNTDSIIADGKSIMEIVVNIPEEATDITTTTLTTSDGIFPESENSSIDLTFSRVVDRNGRAFRVARTELQSSARINSQVILRAEVNNIETYITQDTVKFIKSSPKSIALSVNQNFLLTGFDNEIQISAKMTNATGGVASIGTTAEFFVLDENGNDIFSPDNFRNSSLSSDPQGNVSVKFTLGNSEYRGALNIVARHTSFQQDLEPLVIEDTLRVQIVEGD